MGELAHGRRIAEHDTDALETSVALDEYLLGSIHEHIGHAVIVQERLYRTKPEELGAKCLELIVGQLADDGGAYTLSEHASSRGIGVEGQHHARVKARSDLSAHTRYERRVDHPILRMRASIARNVGARVAN